MLNVTPLPALSDNYIYLLRSGTDVGVVDPGEAAPVQAYLSEDSLPLTHIFLTHHHGDHTGGVEALRAATGAKVIGAAQDAARLPPLDQAVAEGDTVSFGDMHFKVLDTPGHTVGHIAYVGEDYLFCGDTLFSMGCGRVFEGTMEQMWQSLCKLRDLPDATLICCGHEYTESNAHFATHLLPQEKDIALFLGRTVGMRHKGTPTVPASLKIERELNPFLRADAPNIMAALDCTTPVETFTAMRKMKDGF